MAGSQIDIPQRKIRKFCKKYDIKEIALFGSALSGEIKEESDIDLLITFQDNSNHTVFDLVRMKQELQQIFKCKIDLVSKRGIESSRNYIRKNAILDSAEIVYAA
jgi:predicted nucleotidyltransferase